MFKIIVNLKEKMSNQNIYGCVVVSVGPVDFLCISVKYFLVGFKEL